MARHLFVWAINRLTRKTKAVQKLQCGRRSRLVIKRYLLRLTCVACSQHWAISPLPIYKQRWTASDVHDLEHSTLAIWPPRLFLRWEKLNDLSNRLQGVKTMGGWFCLHLLGISCDTTDWPPPSNGQISSPCSGNSQVHSGSYCTVTCDNGFEIDGPSTSVCGNDGEWDPRTSPNCRGKMTVLG